jgi:hypothetical protein
MAVAAVMSINVPPDRLLRVRSLLGDPLNLLTPPPGDVPGGSAAAFDHRSSHVLEGGEPPA